MKSDKNKYVSEYHLRLTEEERDRLQALAKRKGCTIAQFVRTSVFAEENEINEGNFEANFEKEIELSARATVREFKRMAENYRQITSFIISKSKENPNLEPLKRTLKSIENITIHLQKTLNELLVKTRTKEVHVVGPNQSLKGVEAPTSEGGKPRNYYMEKIWILGDVAADAVRYNRKGKDRMRFQVSCERSGRRKGEGRRTVVYQVFADLDDTFSQLMKGKHVLVKGSFDEGEDGEKLVYASAVEIKENAASAEE